MRLAQEAPDPRLRSTAFHEAGHVVVAYRFGFYTGSVTIKPNEDEGILGFSLSEGEWADGSRDAEAVLVYYAGLAAQRLVDPVLTLETSGAGSDYALADRLLRCLGTSQQDMERRAADLVREHRAAIEAVAEALLAFETLHEDEASLVVDCIDEGEDWRVVLPEYRRRWRREDAGTR